jgi:hypothetical protein
MDKIGRILVAIIAAVFELGLVILDGILFFGFTFMNNVETPLFGRISLLLMCVFDPVAFVLSWIRPKVACILLIATSAATLLMSLFASDLHNLQSLWLSGGLFWAAKFLLAAFFWHRSIEHARATELSSVDRG